MEAIRQPWIRTPSAARSRILQRSRICDQHGAPPIVHEALRSPGQPLDAATRAFMEPRFGHDFSGVRVHTDARAAESARAVQALAYTVGRDIVFGDQRYSPQTSPGRRLLAHELTHTLQQRQGIEAGVNSDAHMRSAEGEAASNAARIMNNAMSGVNVRSPVRIARDEDP